MECFFRSGSYKHTLTLDLKNLLTLHLYLLFFILSSILLQKSLEVFPHKSRNRKMSPSILEIIKGHISQRQMKNYCKETFMDNNISSRVLMFECV